MTLPLSIDVLTLRRCPYCRASLNRQDDGYACLGCERMFLQERAVTRFVTAGKYADSFGFKWQRYDRAHFDDVTGDRSDPGRSQRKTCVRCGLRHGVVCEVAMRWGAKVLWVVDLGVAAEAAHNLADREFVASMFLPSGFTPESFDHIYGIGAPHHTPNCEQVVKALPQYTKAGGALAVWLYRAYNQWYRFSDIYRRVVRPLPATTLHGILRVTVPAVNSVGSKLPVLGRSLSRIRASRVPGQPQSACQWRVFDAFDRYSPQYPSKHTNEEVFRWFESCGMEDLHVADAPISVHGREPLL